MNEQAVLDKINKIFEEADYSYVIEDVTDIENFLSDENNTELEFYEVVEELYSELMEDEEL